MILTIPCLPIHGVHTSDELPAFSLELFNHFFHIDYAPFPTVVSLRVFLLLLKRMVIQDSRQGFVFLSDRRAVNFHSGTHLSDEYCFIMFPAALQQDGIVQSASDKQTFGKKVNVNGIFFREIHSVYFERIIIYYIVILKHFLYFVSVSSKRF